MQQTLDIFNRIVQELLSDEQETPVIERIPYEELYQSLDLSLKENPISEEEFEQVVRDLVMKTPRTATNGFFNQLFGGRNDKAVLGDLLAVVLNNSMYTYKVAGPQVGVEKIVLREVCNLIGWDQQSDGTFASGGSLTNLMSMLMARDAANDDVRFSGMHTKMVVYTSEASHYSIPKNAAFTGIGRDNVRYVPVDEFGVLRVDELKKMIAKDLEDGYAPCMVNATAGTTVLGAFDPVDELAEVCQRHNMWLHVDGAYCGGALFSPKYSHLLKGVEKADSFSFNPHKMFGTPLTCSIIVAKDKKYLHQSFSNEADYLYQTDDDELNLGQTSLQCGRRNDALKFWTLWKSVGTSGLEELIDHQFALADTARDYVRSHPDYTLYSFDNSISVCFNYKRIDAKKLCMELYENAKLLVSYGSFNDNDFVRFVTINAQNSHEDIVNFFKTLEQFVEGHPELLPLSAEQ